VLGLGFWLDQLVHHITPLVHQELVEEGLLECRTRKMPKKVNPN
jgi:hypothetical protein